MAQPPLLPSLNIVNDRVQWMTWHHGIGTDDVAPYLRGIRFPVSLRLRNAFKTGPSATWEHAYH
jgi:hypothetical protein